MSHEEVLRKALDDFGKIKQPLPVAYQHIYVNDPEPCPIVGHCFAWIVRFDRAVDDWSAKIIGRT
jgi:hypothetical protein